MQVKYGTFALEPWEAGLEVYAAFERSRSNMKHMQHVRYTIRGEVCASGEYDIDQRIQQIVAAFSTDGLDCGLYHTDGTPTQSVLLSNIPQNLTGNMVLQKQFPDTKDGEFVTGRRFVIQVGAYLLDPEQEILEHRDTIRFQSNAGAQWQWEYNKWWGHYPRMVSPATIQVINHFGYRVGATEWPLPISPFYPPPYELNHLRRVDLVSPSNYKNGNTAGITEWHYMYNLTTFDDSLRPRTGFL